MITLGPVGWYFSPVLSYNKNVTLRRRGGEWTNSHENLPGEGFTRLSASKRQTTELWLMGVTILEQKGNHGEMDSGDSPDLASSVTVFY